MPSNKGYSYTGSGINIQGNHYRARDCGGGPSHQNSYHYSNINGSYYYANPTGSTYYYNTGNGCSTFASASGYRTSSGYGKK